MSKQKISVDKILRAQINNYLVENNILRGMPNCYANIAKEFGTTSEIVRRCHRTLREAGVMSNEKYSPETFVPIQSSGSTFAENNKGEALYTFVTKKRIKTLEDLVDICDIDTSVWDIVSYEVNKWEVGRKEKSVEWKVKNGTVKRGDIHDTGEIFVEPLFQVKAKLSRKKMDKDLGLQKEAVMAEIKAYTADKNKAQFKELFERSVEFELTKRDCTLEINIPDLHIGKLAWGPETGDDYDIKIAVKRYKDAVAELLSRTNVTFIQRYLLVVGHDFLNVDGANNLTTAGTPQSSDSRFYKMVQIGKKLLIETIDQLSLLGFVDVMVVPGNHDSNSMLLMGDILEAWYHESPIVTIYNSPAPRKYYKFGRVGIMYTHGHNEKLDSLGMIFATENKELWANTDFHRVHVGHFHHSKQIKFKDVQEEIGCTIKIISSLSSNDAWHAQKGYLSLKGAEAFLYHKDKGLLANYYYHL